MGDAPLTYKMTARNQSALSGSRFRYSNIHDPRHQSKHLFYSKSDSYYVYKNKLIQIQNFSIQKAWISDSHPNDLAL